MATEITGLPYDNKITKAKGAQLYRHYITLKGEGISDQSLWCVEWPSMAGDALPAARLTISLEAAAGGRVARLRWKDAGDGAAKIVTTHMKIVV